MTVDFLIGALRASRDIPPTVMCEIEEILRKHEQEEQPVVLGYPVKHRRRWREERIKAWEGEHNADGQGQVSGGLEADRAGGERKSRLGLPGMRDAVQETRGAV